MPRNIDASEIAAQKAAADERAKNSNAFSSLTPEQLAAQKNPPTWNDVFNAFNAQHKAVYGKEINRAWNSDQDAQNSKLAIDNLYQQGVDAWNKANNGSAKVDTTVLGVKAQPNSYTPDPEYHGLLNQIWESVKPLAPLALTAVGANFLAPALGELFGADLAGLGGGGGVTEGLIGGGGAGTSINEMIASGLAPGSAGAAGAAAGSLTPEALAAAAGTTGASFAAPAIAAPAATSLNEMVASGMTPGSAGAYGAASGALTPEALAAATGTVGAGSALADLAAAGAAGVPAATPAAAPSINEMVASGTAPGSVGAAGAASGALTPEALAGAGGVVTAGSSLADIASAGDLAIKAKAAADAAAAGSPSLLKQLQDATGLSSTQLATLASGLVGAGNAANLTSAINTGLDATTAANTASQGVLKDIYNQQLGFQKPYQETGVKGLNQLNQLADTGYLQHQFDASDLAKGLAPNYDFMLQQGQMANQRAANVGGGALSGNTLQGLQQFTQNYAGNAYQNAFNNYQNQRQNIYNNLSGLAGIGQTANTGAQAAGTAYGKGTTDLQTALANAQAAAAIGKAQAASQGTTGLANSTFLASLLAPPK